MAYLHTLMRKILPGGVSVLIVREFGTSKVARVARSTHYQRLRSTPQIFPPFLYNNLKIRNALWLDAFFVQKGSSYAIPFWNRNWILIAYKQVFYTTKGQKNKNKIISAALECYRMLSNFIWNTIIIIIKSLKYLKYCILNNSKRDWSNKFKMLTTRI